jgi:hypothetical protein
MMATGRKQELARMDADLDSRMHSLEWFRD